MIILTDLMNMINIVSPSASESIQKKMMISGIIIHNIIISYVTII